MSNSTGIFMPTKLEMITSINQEFLKKLCLYLNHSNEIIGYNKTGEEFIKYISNKFTKKQLETIQRNYLMGQTPEKTALGLKEMNGSDLREKYIEFLRATNKNVKVYIECKIRDRYCDLVLCDKIKREITAIEIKSNGDKVFRAIEQCIEYSKWANFVYILTEKAKERDVRKYPFRKLGIGYIVYHNENFKIKWEAKENPLDKNKIINFLTCVGLRSLLKKNKLKVSGKREDLLKRVLESNVNLFQCQETLIKT